MFLSKGSGNPLVLRNLRNLSYYPCFFIFKASADAQKISQNLNSSKFLKTLFFHFQMKFLYTYFKIFDIFFCHLLIEKTSSAYMGGYETTFHILDLRELRPRMLCNRNGAISHLQTKMGFV